jgi:hypothetical protein
MVFKRAPRGKITKPKNRSSVPRLFQVGGVIERLPAEQSLFLVVQVGGLMWPKTEVQPAGASWSAEIHEGGWPPNGEFALSLYLVGQEGYVEITDWLARGDSTGHYPGMRRIKDSVRLHSTHLKLQTSSRQ